MCIFLDNTSSVNIQNTQKQHQENVLGECVKIKNYFKSKHKL